MTNNFLCAKCHSKLSTTENKCPNCGLEYEIKDNYIKYNYKKLLFQEHKDKFLLNSVLNNNGFLSYHLLRSGSLSLPDRQDVINFKNYILKYSDKGNLLDIGCGILETPGYLNFNESERKEFKLYGLDPIEESQFSGCRIIGCSEYMPFEDNYFNTIIFATSLDHVCSLDQTLKEVSRILKSGGKIIIWMSDRTEPPVKKKKIGEIVNEKIEEIKNDVKDFIKGRKKYVEKNPKPQIPNGVIRDGNYVIYPDLTILYVPPSAIDPFHSYKENPTEIIKSMAEHNLELVDMSYNGKNEVFLVLKKKNI